MNRLLTTATENTVRRQIRRAAFARRCRKLRVPVLILSVAVAGWWAWRTPRIVAARRLDDSRVELIVEQAGRLRVQIRSLEP